MNENSQYIHVGTRLDCFRTMRRDDLLSAVSQPGIPVAPGSTQARAVALHPSQRAGWRKGMLITMTVASIFALAILEFAKIARADEAPVHSLSTMADMDGVTGLDINKESLLVERAGAENRIDIVYGGSAAGVLTIHSASLSLKSLAVESNVDINRNGDAGRVAVGVFTQTVPVDGDELVAMGERANGD